MKRAALGRGLAGLAGVGERGGVHVDDDLIPLAGRAGIEPVPERRLRHDGEGVGLLLAVLRPPLALARLTESSGGPLLYQFRRPWSDGSTALLLAPLELLERLAALVPPPRRPLLAYHGVLGPRAQWRSAVVPRPARAEARPAGPGAPQGPARLTWARLLRRVFAIDLLVCPRCGGPRRMLGAVTQPHAVRRLLTTLGLAAAPPPARPVPAS